MSQKWETTAKTVTPVSITATLSNLVGTAHLRENGYNVMRCHGQMKTAGS